MVLAFRRVQAWIASMGVKPISFTDQLPLIFRGHSQIPNIGIASVSKPGVDDRQARLIKQMYANSNLANVFLAQRNWGQARLQLQTLLSLDPDNQPARELLRNLELEINNGR